MNSQGIPSTEVLSLISDVTEPDEVSGDVNAYFQKITFPETGKTVYKCSFVKKVGKQSQPDTRTKEEYFCSLIFKKRPK